MVEQLALGFGGLLRQLRAEAGLTQEELAEAATASRSTQSNLGNLGVIPSGVRASPRRRRAGGVAVLVQAMGSWRLLLWLSDQ